MIDRNIDYILNRIDNLNYDLKYKIIKKYYHICNKIIINKQIQLKHILINKELAAYTCFYRFIDNLYNTNSSFYKLYTNTYLYIKMIKTRRLENKF